MQVFCVTYNPRVQLRPHLGSSRSAGGCVGSSMEWPSALLTRDTSECIVGRHLIFAVFFARMGRRHLAPW